MTQQEILKRLSQLGDAISVVQRVRGDVDWETVNDESVNGLIESDKKRFEIAFSEFENAVKAIRKIPEHS